MFAETTPEAALVDATRIQLGVHDGTLVDAVLVLEVELKGSPAVALLAADLGSAVFRRRDNLVAFPGFEPV